MISKQGTNQEFKKCFSEMYLGIRGKSVGYAGTLCCLCNFFIILKQLKLSLLKNNTLMHSTWRLQKHVTKQRGEKPAMYIHTAHANLK